MKCRASIGFIAKHRSEIPADTGSSYAREGTEAHQYAERLLLGDKKVVRPKSTEMVACIEEGYVPFVQAQSKRAGLKRVPPEARVALFYDRSQKGTCDAPLLGEERIIIVDLKYGAGISVEAKFNTQLAIYAESTIREYEVKHDRYHRNTPVELIIYQPRAQDNRFVRKWELSRGDLAEFCVVIRDVAHDILMDPDNQPFAPDADTTCRYCPAKAFCSPYAAHLLEETPPVVEKALQPLEVRLSLPVPSKLSDSQLIKLLRIRGDLEDWFDEVEEYILAKMTKGQRYEGLKVVEGKSNRRWTDEKAARKLLLKVFPESELVSEEFLSPAAAGKLIKSLRKKPSTEFSNSLAKLIDKPDGKPKIAPKEDPRPPLELGDPVADLCSELI